jgi:hypothetical protein
VCLYQLWHIYFGRVFIFKAHYRLFDAHTYFVRVSAYLKQFFATHVIKCGNKFMNYKPFRLKFFTLFFAILLAFSSIGFAQEAEDNEVKKLPPVNWIRSRDVDM